MRFSRFSFLLLGFVSSSSFAAMEFKEADITTVKNIVERNEGTGAVPAKVNDKIHENSKVSTSAASMAELTFADSSITRMGANTQFSFASKERLVKLDQGTVLIHTPPGNGGATVDCGGVTAAVSGTTFMASRDAGGNAMFVLLEGQGGLKITVGGSSTVIRPGQAASVGADAIQEAKSSGSADATPGGGKPGASTAAADDQKPGGTGQGSGSTGGGGEGGGTPPAAPKIQVFEVDVKKVVSTTPLIVEFKSELPSVAKIEKTIEVQQAKVQEGKLEKLEVEVVAVKNKDGDLLVGAPKVEKEEMVVVNKKADLVAGAGSGNNLDIDTAAGPGAGGGGPAPDARPAPAPAPVAQATPAPAVPTPPTSVSVVSQVASTSFTPTRPSPTSLDFTVASDGTARATLDQITTQAAPVGIAVTSIPGLNLSPNSTTIPAGSATSGGFTLSLANPRAFFPGWDSSFNLNPLVLTATAGAFTDLETTSALWPTRAIEKVNPVRTATDVSSMPRKVLAALDAYFYFDQRAPGVTQGPPGFHVAAVSSLDLSDSIQMAASSKDLGIDWTRGFPTSDEATGEIFEFHPARSLVASGANSTVSLNGQNRVLYGDSVQLRPNTSGWSGSSGAYDPATAISSGSLSGTASLANTLFPLWEKWEFSGSVWSPSGSWRTWNDEGGNLASTLDLNLGVPVGGHTPGLILLSGEDGNSGSAALQISGMDFDVNGGRLNLLSAGSARIEAVWFREIQANAGLASPWSWSDADIEDRASFTLEASEKVTLGASAPAPEAVADTRQVRIEAVDTSSGGSLPPAPKSLAVVRSGDSLELRNVVIRGFAGAKLEGAAGRVLVSGTTMRDFKIKELAGLAVNADAKIQMAVVDAGGNLAGTMQVAGGLPVEKVDTGQVRAVAMDRLNTKAEEVKLDAKEVLLAADKIHIGTDALRTQISAQNLIQLQAQTVVMQNSFMSVASQTGMINVYVPYVSGTGLVNTTYGTTVAGMLNFMGANTFNIGSLTFHVRDQSSLNEALQNRYVNDTTTGGPGVVSGAMNVIPL